MYLAAAGLPVPPDGLLVGACPGAFVWTDPAEQVTGMGVYARWIPAPVMLHDVRESESDGDQHAWAREREHQVVLTMAEAMRAMLGFNGFAVDVSEGTLYVADVPSTLLSDLGLDS
jgi:hypothetical protein